jgi:signal transduction histidine kinase
MTLVGSGTNRPLILVVDDDEGMLILMAEALRAEAYEVATANSAKKARTWLKENTPELMLLDLKLQDSDGPALISALQQEKSLVPFIVVTGQGDEKVAVDVMKQGALDYVMKDTALIDLLPSVVKHALSSITQERALSAARDEHVRLEREVMAVSERERHSIGADLHDGLGQQLTAIELMIAGVKADAVNNPSLTRSLDSVGKMLRDAIAQTRFLSRGLVPLGSGADSLHNGLTELAERMNGLRAVRCTFNCSRLVLVENSFVSGHLYRIAQEAVNNAAKHARATQVTIRLARSHGILLLEVSDNGVGLGKKRVGLGLGVMQHRAKVVGGELQIASKKGEGVKITCRVPLK